MLAIGSTKPVVTTRASMRFVSVTNTWKKRAAITHNPSFEWQIFSCRNQFYGLTIQKLSASALSCSPVRPHHSQAPTYNVVMVLKVQVAAVVNVHHSVAINSVVVDAPGFVHVACVIESSASHAKHNVDSSTFRGSVNGERTTGIRTFDALLLVHRTRPLIAVIVAGQDQVNPVIVKKQLKLLLDVLRACDKTDCIDGRASTRLTR